MKPIASILISNYNKFKYLEKCIQSCLAQTFLNFEIIIFDDNSTDRSNKILKKYENNKKIKIIYNKKQVSKYTSFNQIKAIKEAFKKSSGKYIFLLDADDFFGPKKIDYIVKIFKKNNLNYIQDKFYLINSNKIIKKKIKEKFFATYWNTIYPTSCMSFKRSYLNTVIKRIDFAKNTFKDVTFDLRCQIFNKNFEKKTLNLNKYFTYYRINTLNYSKNYSKFNVNWWNRRLQATKYTKELFKHEKKIFLYNLDFFITNLFSKIKK